MSDSLRDQLLKAGFSAPAAKPRPKPKNKPKNKPNARHNAGASQAGASQASGSQKRSQQSNTTTSSEGLSNQPKAGYTYVPATPAKKKKKKKAPAVKPRAGSWGTRSLNAAPSNTSTGSDSEATVQWRAMKSDIQAIIENSQTKDYKGEKIYRFTLKNKIRELSVSDPIHKQLASGALAITRLDGSTRLIPAEAAQSIRDISSQWAVFLSTDVEDSTEDDDEHPIPDDLMW